MLVSITVLLVILCGMFLWARAQEQPPHRQAIEQAWLQLQALALRLPLALIAAGFIAQLLPHEQVIAYLGADSGVKGVLIASVLGAFLPGGPMVAFPLAIVLFEAGTGSAQMVALLTSWSVLALHRIMSFELPLMGNSFVVRRILPSLPLPVIAGLIALWVA
ncbi:MAG: permease [Pseudomonadales bacterium]|nr:permease [Pseudomonadales bacterium]